MFRIIIIIIIIIVIVIIIIIIIVNREREKIIIVAKFIIRCLHAMIRRRREIILRFLSTDNVNELILKKEKNFLRLYLNLIYTNSEAKLVIAALIKFKAKISPRREEIYEISDRGGEGEEGEGGSS